MQSFPYQLVAFLDREPTVGESIYNSPAGWYPQIALKRRFAINGISEEEFAAQLAIFLSSTEPVDIMTGELVKTDRMPVQVVEVDQTEEIMSFHASFIEKFSNKIISRYPDREGANYYPHITAEYDGKRVIDETQFINKSLTITSVWLVKDRPGNEDALAYKKFELN